MRKPDQIVLGFVMLVGMAVGAFIDGGNYYGAAGFTAFAFLAGYLVRTNLEARAEARDKAVGLVR